MDVFDEPGDLVSFSVEGRGHRDGGRAQGDTLRRVTGFEVKTAGFQMVLPELYDLHALNPDVGCGALWDRGLKPA
jgi:hypothetical protein